MIRQGIAFCLLCLLFVGSPMVVYAQEQASEMDEAVFERLAQRAEVLAARDDASLFAISRLRAELVVWRDEFLARSNLNAGRLATVDSQLAALGTVPESGEEAADVAARRAELIAQRTALQAPGLLAQEAHARANGLIGEFDARSLQQQRDELTVRGSSPLNPTHVVGAITALFELTRLIGVEVAAGLSVKQQSGQLGQALPRVLALAVVAVALLGAGRRLVTRWQNRFAQGHGRWRPLLLFFFSAIQLLVPLIGVFVLTEALQSFDIFGLRGNAVIDAIPVAGLFVILGWWLSRLLFPVGEIEGYLGYDPNTCARGRVLSVSIAWILALQTLVGSGLETMDMTKDANAAFAFPILLALGVLFWQLGRAIATKPQEREVVMVSAGRMRGYLGQAITLVAIAAPLLAAVGYTAAASALLGPAILSVALIGVLFLLQRIVHDLIQKPENEEDFRGIYALIPVFISFALILTSLPIFALIWGARVSDLTELWTRFREGFAVGDSRISPTDFVTFAVVFALGYILTRLIQGTLRKSVLPRTRLDLGGQNAIVAGFGYVGIILAAIVAITSAGIDLSNLAIVAGALSVGIGFGLQNIVSNFVSGIILLIERPVSEGDWIEVGGQMGYVRAISVRSTRIETFDRTDVIIPNADLVSGQVTNWTRGNLVGRVIVPVGVAYGTDVDKVTEILQGIAEAHPLVVMTPPPAVLFQGFGADSLDFEIRAILRDVNYVLVTKSEMNHAIAKEFAAAGIEIPFAQRDIWLRNPEVLKDPIPT
ncbi:small-conductance mechanosensitive channel [Yoonia maricola]|uniref:Small-conductance mechanosensitive channel n=1 Tax=Yoonia maricola TaxID=420999 RepID=A0A2M8WLD6_9RHOB|nr:mechanosensitive ion channel domain-containing protein [Yoonia maricola]PJI91742.1 small-conductance mechanosensitive channel [Yoonia maricola]